MLIFSAMFKSVVLNQQFFASRFCRVKIAEPGSFFTALSICLNTDNLQNSTSVSQVEETASMMRRWLLREEEWELYRQHMRLDEKCTFEYVCQPNYSVDDAMLTFVSKRIGISIVVVCNGSNSLAYNVQDFLPSAPLVILLAKTNCRGVMCFGPILHMDNAHAKQMRSLLSKALMGVTPTQTARARQVNDVLIAPHVGVLMRTNPVVARILKHAQVRSSDA